MSLAKSQFFIRLFKKDADKIRYRNRLGNNIVDMNNQYLNFLFRQPVKPTKTSSVEPRFCRLCSKPHEGASHCKLNKYDCVRN